MKSNKQFIKITFDENQTTLNVECHPDNFYPGLVTLLAFISSSLKEPARINDMVQDALTDAKNQAQNAKIQVNTPTDTLQIGDTAIMVD